MFNVMQTTVVYKLTGAIKPGVCIMGIKCLRDISGNDTFWVALEENKDYYRNMYIACIITF